MLHRIEYKDRGEIQKVDGLGSEHYVSVIWGAHWIVGKRSFHNNVKKLSPT